MLDARFADRLLDYELRALDQFEGSIVGLWPDLTIAYTNLAWERFALANGGEEVLRRWGLGAPLLTGISGELRGFFGEALRRVSQGAAPESVEYECSSSAFFRQFKLRVQRLPGGSLLLIHAPVVVQPHADARTAMPPVELNYRQAGGLITQCSYCGCVLRAGTPAWDWVPAFLERKPPRVSHGVCPTCSGYYFPNERDTVPAPPRHPADPGAGPSPL